MILVDSSVWIDVLADRDTPQRRVFERLTGSGEQRIGIGDLVMTEVLQGIRHEREFRRSLAVLSMFDVVRIADRHVAEQAARNYRTLRDKGITVRKTIDTLIATRCILDDAPLLYADRDFDPFVAHLNLKSALPAGTGVS